MTTVPSRGRPPAASREMLQDAAFELFLEQGYAGTTVEHITRRAGVSRNTFFNYFDAKGDVFWVEVDAALATLQHELQRPASGQPLTRLAEILLRLAEQLGPMQVPFALTQHELIGSAADLQASMLARLTGASRSIRLFLVAAGVHPDLAPVVAHAITGATIAAAQRWATAGPARGTLSPYLAEALDPLLDGFGRALPS